MGDVERVCIYIDGSNFYHSLKDECGRARLDLSAFSKRLLGSRHLVRTYYYNAALCENADKDEKRKQQRFFETVRRLPYFDVRLGRMEPRGGTFVEKGVDVAIAVDMITMAFRGIYDTAILVSCDGDYVKAIDAIRDTGKHVEVACFRKAYHLKQVADKVINLNKRFFDDLWLNMKTGL
jgi:uncharacterized LabA/DUF88 family protein